MATMLRWRWVLLAWMIGGCLLAYGVLVEIELRREVGGGLRRFTGHGCLVPKLPRLTDE